MVMRRAGGERGGCGWAGRSGLEVPSPVRCARATKAVKIADYNRGFPHRTQLFIIAASFPPGALCSPHVAFFVSYFGGLLLAFYHHPPPAHWPPQWHDGCDDVFISFASFISLRFFSLSFFCFIFLFLFHTSENICICARLLHVLLQPLPFSSPHSLSHFLPRLLPLCRRTLPPSPLVALCCLLPFALICVLFVLFAVSLCFLFLSPPSPLLLLLPSSSRYLPPRFSNLLICELLCSHYNSFCSVSFPSLFIAFRWGIQASRLLRGYWGGPANTL